MADWGKIVDIIMKSKESPRAQHTRPVYERHCPYSRGFIALAVAQKSYRSRDVTLLNSKKKIMKRAPPSQLSDIFPSFPLIITFEVSVSAFLKPRHRCEGSCSHTGDVLLWDLATSSGHGLIHAYELLFNSLRYYYYYCYCLSNQIKSNFICRACIFVLIGENLSTNGSFGGFFLDSVLKSV